MTLYKPFRWFMTAPEHHPPTAIEATINVLQIFGALYIFGAVVMILILAARELYRTIASTRKETT